MNWQHVGATIKGAWKSLTVRFGGLLMILPDALPMIKDQWPTIAPFIPDALESRVMNVIALGILLLRVRTTKSLADKVGK